MMKLLREGLAVVIIFLLGASQAAAGEWQIVGPRALGMGGANVAVANDATASHWNPAAFGFFDQPEQEDDYGKRGWSSQLGVGVGTQIHEDLVQQVDKISKFNFTALSGTLQVDQVSNFIQLVDNLGVFAQNDNRAVSILVNAGSRSQFGHFGLAANAYFDVSAKASIDLVNIAPRESTGQFSIDEFTDPANFSCPSSPCTTVSGGLSATQEATLTTNVSALPGWSSTNVSNFVAAIDNGLAAAEVAGEPVPVDIVSQITNVATVANTAANLVFGAGSLSENGSALLFKGIALFEVPLTYGRAFSDNLSIGGNLKYMKARVYDISIPVLGDNQDFRDKLDKAIDSYTDKTNFGVDLGALYRFGDNLRVGLVGRNLNSPKFGSIKERAQLRTGIAYKPLSFVTLATDIDLTKNDTTVGGSYKSQNIAAGLEISIVKILMLRGGLYKNLAENDIGLVYTVGLGLNLWLINLDIGAAMSKDKTQIDGDDLPEEVRVAFALSMLF